VRIEIYNSTGQKVWGYNNPRQQTGRHIMRWHGVSEKGAALASGVYLCRVITAKAGRTFKLALIR
jgi:flagellar hook assembly protein FlgD